MASKIICRFKNAPSFIARTFITRPFIVMAVTLAVILLSLGEISYKLKAASQFTENDPPLNEARQGRWGELRMVPTVISPPMELISTNWGKIRRPTWFFPDTTPEKAAQILQGAGVSASDAARAQSTARPDSQTNGIVLTPDPAFVRSLAPDVRGRVYAILAKSERNSDQVRAFMYPGSKVDAWLDPQLISPRMRKLVEPLIYRSGDYMMFSDIELVRAEINDDDELRRLSKALFRQPTVMAYLSVDSSADLDSLVEYWGRGGRRTKIRSLMEAVAAGGGDRLVDIIHLLPPFVQERLYCYPTFSDADLNKPTLANCLYSALNFFEPKANDRFLDPATAIKALKEDYFIVTNDFMLGDIVVFLDEQGKIYHAAVYIAYDLVFSKNGISSMAPWMLMSIDEVKGYYKLRSENPKVLFHRKKDL